MKNKIMFIGMDIPNEIEKVIADIESSITNGMTEGEIKACKYGIKTSIAILSQLLDSVEDDEFAIHINGKTNQEELVLSDLYKIIEN